MVESQRVRTAAAARRGRAAITDKEFRMTRPVWLLAALVACSFSFSGCAMCEHCLDYEYPAFGGCAPWHADDHCRAGSAFCGMHGGPGFDMPPGAIEYADPVPYDSGSSGRHGEDVMTPTPMEETPPTDLSPQQGSSRRLRPSGNDPLPSTDPPDSDDLDDEGPEPPSLDVPPADEEPIPDPFGRE
jgi:hypothetical protein